MDIKSVKGMNDVVEPEVYIWRFAEKLIKKHLEDFGFAEIKTPIVELTSLFARTVGDTTDIVQKEMYTFNDRNEESLTLRPEGTAPVVRAVIEHNLLNNDPVQKLYYWGPMFRYERPQKGRYRQFHQFGVEVFGIANPRMDAELIFLLVDLHDKMGLKNLSVRLSSMGCDVCRPSFVATLSKALMSKKEVLCPDCQNRLEKNPLRVLDCKNPKCQEVIAGLPSMLDFLCEECHVHFDGVRDDLVRLKVSFFVDKRLVRGFDYYNRTVFEITTDQLGAQNAVGGGGRYDNLVASLGGPSCPAIGYAGGIERLILLLGSEKTEKFLPTMSLFFVLPDDKGKDLAFRLVNQLRSAGIRAEIDYTDKSMKSQMKRADRLRAQYVLILGGDEMARGVAVLRNMKTKAQEEIKLNDLESDLYKRLGRL